MLSTKVARLSNLIQSGSHKELLLSTIDQIKENCLKVLQIHMSRLEVSEDDLVEMRDVLDRWSAELIP